MTEANGEELVVIRRHWNDYRKATVPFAAVQGLHWAVASGGVARRSPRPMLTGYLWCDALGEQDFAHSCTHGPPPHRIKVVIAMVDNPRALVRRMRAEADATGAGIGSRRM